MQFNKALHMQAGGVCLVISHVTIHSFEEKKTHTNNNKALCLLDSSQQHTKCQLSEAQYECHSMLTIENGHHGNRHDQDAEKHVSYCQ